MYDLDKKFDLVNVYFFIDKTKGVSTPMLLTDNNCGLLNLYNEEKITTNKVFPFRTNIRSRILTNNLSCILQKPIEEFSIHRLWWLLSRSKYLSNISLIKRIQLKRIDKKGSITFKDIIEINDIINNSKKLSKEFKKTQKLSHSKNNTL